MMTTERRYIRPPEATRIRVHSERSGEWSIDAADDDGNFTEECWNRDGAIDRTMTFDRAIERVNEFRNHLGLPAGIPTEVWVDGRQHSDSDAMVSRARLNAAAPELLASLIDCRDWLMAIIDSNLLSEEDRATLARATEAIEKAGGD